MISILTSNLLMSDLLTSGLLVVTDRTFGSGSVVRPNLAVRPGSAEPPNQQILPNQNRTNSKLRFYLIFELTRGHLVLPMISLLMKITKYYLKTDPLFCF